MKLIGKQIFLDPGDFQTPKMITGTRLATILGKNEYATPFQCWCELQKVWNPPFEDTIYTLAGKTIEPAQATYIKDHYCPTLVYPKDKFGDNYFNKTRGNFFNDEHFGGMWDYLDEKDGVVNCVYEMKTAGKSKKSNWSGDKIPESYALQAALYAWLLKCDNVTMVATFLDQKLGDYDFPQLVIVSEDNTILKSFKLSERFPNFEQDFIQPALNWWNEHIVTGISPEFDPKNETDNEILHELAEKGLLTLEETAEHNLLTIEEPETASYQDLDDLINEISSKFGLYAPLSFVDLTKYRVELATAIYHMSAKAVRLDDKVGLDKIHSARDMLQTLNTLDPGMANLMMTSRRLNE